MYASKTFLISFYWKASNTRELSFSKFVQTLIFLQQKFNGRQMKRRKCCCSENFFNAFNFNLILQFYSCRVPTLWFPCSNIIILTCSCLNETCYSMFQSHFRYFYFSVSNICTFIQIFTFSTI